MPFIAQLTLLGAVYYGAAVLGLHYASIGQSISLVWPPTGIAIAALTILGYRYWPGIAAGAFLANATTPVPLLAAAGIALGNTCEALIAARLLRGRRNDPPSMDDFRHVRALVLGAAPAGALCSALIGCASLWLANVLQTSGLLRAIAVWWTGDLLGALVVAPVFLTWATTRTVQQNTRGLVEVVLLCVGTAVAAELGLGPVLSGAFATEVNYTYLLFPFVIWAALRFGARGASLMTLIVAILTVVRTVEGGSPFVSNTAIGTLFALACYLVAVAITGLGLSAAVRWERHEATRALAQSEERLRRALDAARMGTWFWSVESNSLTWDENLRRIYGLGPQERISSYQDFLSRVHPGDRGVVEETVRKALEESSGLDHEFRILLPDGQVRWIADQSEIRRDEQGRPLNLAGICADVTERRTAEERLRQAHRMESVGRLAGGVAHEANNQMSVVLGASAFILQRTDVPKEVRTDVEFMQKAAERTAAVTGQLLAFSRRQVLKPELIDLNTLVKGWEPVLRRIMGEDVGVELRLGPETGLVKADPGQLEQVLLNLALNARDAMPRGGHITVETGRAELSPQYARTKAGITIEPGDYAVLAVSDQGHGMNRETLSHIFEPFFTTKSAGQGTGLGLSMVYGIVKQSQGYVWAYSEPGQGSVFKIYLPSRSGTLLPAARNSSPGLAAKGETILVVEDEAPVRYMMTRALREAGYRVLEAGNGAEALALVERNSERIELLLTDVVMPGKSGRELAEELRARFPEMAVLYASGYTDGEITRRGLLAPGAALVEKPVTPSVLVRAVQKTISARQPAPRQTP
jgi:PAS domain S-box-containing protein